ncbi:MAG TPA: MerR family transcriptional regulator [Gammaproteobacteria bacterium]|nr:MerR family transcriptional regulator [Gammaproteobacteria bacterium]
MASSEPKHPIQVVARRTGLSAEVIRVWEKRYGAVIPKRSQTQRRFYSDADVERLRLLKRVTEMGRRISDIARLSNEALAYLAAEDTVSVTSVPQSAPPSADNRTQEYLGACLAAVKDLNPAVLEIALVQASMSLGISVLFEEILTPLLSTIGAEWRDDDLRGIHERVASAQVRTFLGSLLHTSNIGHFGPMLLATTPAGQHRELGALMLAVTAASSGWNAIYLGADTPAGKIVAAATQTGALAVSLNITRANDPRLPEELRQLRRYLPDNIQLLVSGSGAWGYREVLDAIGATYVGSLRELRQELEALRAPVQTLLAEQRVYSESRESRVVIGEWIWEQDPSGRYIYSNSAVKDLLGYEPEEVLGKHYLGLFTREYREYMAGDFPESTDPKHCFFHLINRYRHKDGHEVITESTGEPIFDKEGKLIKWRGMDRYITAHKRFKDALQQV